MRKFALLAAATFAAISAPVLAGNKPPKEDKPNPPTLHGFCSLAAQCYDNNTNTPTNVNPPAFSFSYGGQSATGTGSLWVDILVPNNVAGLPTSFTISGALLGSSTYTANLFKPTAWTSGQLDQYLGINASPTNPIGAYILPGDATGWYVFQANVGTVTLLAQNDVNKPGQDAYLMQLSESLATGSYILGYLGQGGAYGATANSGAIREIGSPPPPAVPEPTTWAMMLIGFGAAGTAMRRTRKKTVFAQCA